MKAITILVCLLVAGCGANVQPIFAPNGKVGYQVTCRTPMACPSGHMTQEYGKPACDTTEHLDYSRCWEAGAKQCGPAGFDIMADVDKSAHHELLIVCKDKPYDLGY